MDFLKEELEEAGVELPEVPFGLAEIAVTRTVRSASPNRAFSSSSRVILMRPGYPAAPVLVLAGFKLKEISLQPESAITTGSRLLIENSRRSKNKKEENEGEAEEEEEDDEVNPPLILTTTISTLVTRRPSATSGSRT